MTAFALGYPRLVGDIGGTRARFASLAAPGAALADRSVHECDDFAGIEALLRHRLSRASSARPASCALGIATPMTGDRVRMTNRDWSFSIEALRRSIGCDRLVVVNDFAALALGVPTLGADDVTEIGGDLESPLANKAVLGAGTGLGVAGLVHAAGAWRAIAGEGGHVSLAPESALEDELLRILRESLGRVSAERVLSGPGVVRLHEAICRVHGTRVEPSSAAEITRRALDRSDAACVQAIECFLGWLGAVAGDVALTFGALGGVYLGGGIVPRLLPVLATSPFRARFENKGRYRSYVAAIPVRVIADSSSAALRGADRALDLEA